MRRGRIFIYLAFILLLGLIAVFVVWQQFLQPDPTPAQPLTEQQAPVATTAVRNVVMLAQRATRGTAIRREMLQLVPYPEEQIIPGMFTNVDDVEGQLAKYDLEAGIPLTSGVLVRSANQLSTTGSNAALDIPAGMVAIAIPIDRLSSVAFAPRSGDHVNIIATLMLVDLDTEYQSLLPNHTIGIISPGEGQFAGSAQGQLAVAEGGTSDSRGTQMSVESSSISAITGGGGSPMGRAEIDPVIGQTFYLIPSEEQRPRMISHALLQDAIVLHMGTFPTAEEEQMLLAKPTPTPVPEGVQVEQQNVSDAEPTAAPPSPDVITVVVPPQDAVTLTYLMYQGARFNLALRSTGDNSREELEAVTLQFLLDQYQFPVPVKLPYGLEPRVDVLHAPSLMNDLLATPTP